MINYSIRILPSNKRFVKLIESHVIEFAVDNITEIN
jgi:hypothetical protein